ncbi:MAG: hypothetical protein IJT91_06295 [Clostridia bacterium]|nr:hypothetical protein [Clostridia bacterium]
MKKLISLAITAVMLFALAVPAFAVNYVGNLDFSLTNAAGKQNDEITVELKLNENPGLYGFFIILYYDSDVFILRDIEFDEELLEFGGFEPTKANLSADELTGPINTRALESFAEYNIDTSNLNFKVLMYTANGLDEDTDFTGTVAKITFQIMGIAEDGDYTIGMMPAEGNFINAKMEDLSVTWTNATVRVGDEKAPVETQKPITFEDTQEPEDITTESEPNPDDPIKPVDTDTETAPVTDESGETVKPIDTEKDDVQGEDEKKEQTTIEVMGQNIPVIYIIIAVILILAAVAAILFVILSKTKKKKQ